EGRFFICIFLDTKHCPSQHRMGFYRKTRFCRNSVFFVRGVAQKILKNWLDHGAM
ncbi:hypothetical protein M153_8050004170, partial [Pseudoloma neurophilia]